MVDTPHPALTHFRNFSNSVTTYIADLKEALGSNRDANLTQLDTETLAYIGRAIGEERKRIGYDEIDDINLHQKL